MDQRYYDTAYCESPLSSKVFLYFFTTWFAKKFRAEVVLTYGVEKRARTTSSDNAEPSTSVLSAPKVASDITGQHPRVTTAGTPLSVDLIMACQLR